MNQTGKPPKAVVIGVGPDAGLGAALCRRFAKEEHHVLVASRTTERIEKVARSIEASGGRATAVPTDCTSEDDVIKLFDLAMADDETAPADLVVFNAGNNARHDLDTMSAAFFRGRMAQPLPRRISGGTRSQSAVRRARTRHGDLYWCHRLTALAPTLHRVRLGQSGPTRDRAIDGTGSWSERRTCRPCGHRWRDQWRTTAIPSTGPREQDGRRRAPRSGRARRCLLASAQPITHCLDLRA